MPIAIKAMPKPIFTADMNTTPVPRNEMPVKKNT